MLPISTVADAHNPLMVCIRCKHTRFQGVLAALAAHHRPMMCSTPVVFPDFRRPSAHHPHLPEAVLVETLDGMLKPALCYIAPSMEDRPATNEYIDRIVGPARRHGFPAWYVTTL